MKRRTLTPLVLVTLLVVGGSMGCVSTAAQESQPEQKTVQTRLPIAAQEHYDLLYLTPGDRAAFIADTAKEPGAGTLEVPVYRQDQLLWDNGGCFYLGRNSHLRDALGLRLDSFANLQTLFPSEAVRRMGDGETIYVMYDTESEGRLFPFFSDVDGYAFADGFPVLMKRRLAHEDFRDVAAGDGINSVEGIDPVISSYRVRFDSMNDVGTENWTKMGVPPTSVHLLTDGIVKIEYRRDAMLGYVITGILYDEGFVPEGFGDKTCYRIAAEDYVD
jgi:hypothetical protein